MQESNPHGLRLDLNIRPTLSEARIRAYQTGTSKEFYGGTSLL